MANIPDMEEIFFDVLRRYEAEVRMSVYEADPLTVKHVLHNLKQSVEELKLRWKIAKFAIDK